jgi:cobyrinic acid a,c-diamide synthase
MQSSHCPALLVAAPASSQGKTTVTSALARLHTRQGRKVRVFKCGPDFLDPYWHSLASGAPVYHLDLWMTGEADCRARLTAAAADADLILVEGVMGLFDGTPSAADLARRFGLHVLAVVDASAMAGTFGALAFGLQHYQGGLPWAGVLANRVAGAGHADMLRESLNKPQDWLGALMHSPALVLPERHLGLTVASEVPDALARLDAAADALSQTPLGRMTLEDLQRWNTEFLPADESAEQTTPKLLKGRVIAVARDAAFCFIYAANLDCLQALGAELRFFSPLANEALPACDAVWLPGGYPELHADQMAASTRTRDGLAQHIAAGLPLWAECGGMMALLDTLVTVGGQRYAQWGLLPGVVSMHERLAALGPQQLTLKSGTLRGHTFHFSTTATTMHAVTRTARPDAAIAAIAADAGEALWQKGSVRASYFHAWFPSAPLAAAELFGAAIQEIA